MKQIKTIGFLTKPDPYDKRSWSGIYFRMLESLSNEFESVIPLGPLPKPYVDAILRIIQKVINILNGKKYNRSFSPLLARAYARSVERKLEKTPVDAIFAPTASPLISHLKTDIPIYYYSDASVASMINYYDSFTNLLKLSLREAHQIEQKAIEHSKAVIFASDWALQGAWEAYGIPKEKLHVIKMGANIDSAPSQLDIATKLKTSVCNLLFLGVDWNRKGGPIVFQTFNNLLASGFDAELIVCGCVPPVTHPKMKVYPFLNKNLEKDSHQFTEILDNAHFLFLPTRAECAGIVFCEAAANGIPSITTNTGGVPSYVDHNITGFTLPLNAQADEYAQLIREIFNDKNRYRALSENARLKYLNELNWETWGEKMRVCIQENIN
jgi:glycosyltransferase involved in cell wall biosynthesis